MSSAALAEILPEEKVIEQLGVSRTTLWRWRRQGKLACFKLGAKVAYSPSHIRDLLERSEQKEEPSVRRRKTGL